MTTEVVSAADRFRARRSRAYNHERDDDPTVAYVRELVVASFLDAVEAELVARSISKAKFAEMIGMNKSTLSAHFSSSRRGGADFTTMARFARALGMRCKVVVEPLERS